MTFPYFSPSPFNLTFLSPTAIRMYYKSLLISVSKNNFYLVPIILFYLVV